MKVSEILKVTGGRLLSGDPEREIDLASISTDSRTIRKGSFFLPIKGENFDGEKFINEAFRKGAVGTFTTNYKLQISNFKLQITDYKKVIIFVKDTTEALQDIAHAHRMKFDMPVIGITGSNGKTTTKDMVYSVLSSRFNVLRNEGTKNNHLGVPQTLLKLNKKHDICVLEMGMNHRGEIRLLADIARPTMAVITNIGPSHLKFLKSLEGVFSAKKEITEFLKKGSLLIVNGDDRYLAALKGRRFCLKRFGFDESNDYRAAITAAGPGYMEFLLNDKDRFRLNMLGTPNIYNALAAIAVARNFKMGRRAIASRLASCRPANMRLNMKKIGGVTIVNDAYNSNPLSMQCALETMKYIPARAKWIVSADMLELGKREKDFHGMVGEAVARSGFNGLVTFGRLSRYTHKRAAECGMAKECMWHCATKGEAARLLRSIAKKGDAVLVKGSRAMKMEEVVERLKGAA